MSPIVLALFAVILGCSLQSGRVQSAPVDNCTDSAGNTLSSDSDDGSIYYIIQPNGTLLPTNCPADLSFSLTNCSCSLHPEFTAYEGGAVDAAAYCMDCANRRNTKDHYPDPTGNCHVYYQCFYYDEITAVGIRRECPPGLYFSKSMLTCVREIGECDNPCDNQNVSLPCASWLNSCNQYFVCASSGAELLCCPTGTRFDLSSCGCVADDTCNDFCVGATPAIPTSVAPPVRTGDFCIDSFGNTLTTGDTDAFFRLVKADGATIQLACAIGSSFSLDTCSCGNDAAIAAPQPSANRCLVYLPFDTDFADYSFNRFTTFEYGDVFIDNSTYANGGGSLLLQGGRVEIPGTKTLDLQLSGSWCLFFQCVGTSSNPNACTINGGLFSDNNNANSTDFVLILAALAGNLVQAQLEVQHPISFQTVSAPVNNGWNQVCVVFSADGNGVGTIYLYVNNALAATTSFSGWSNIAACPYTVGSDQKYGDFYGNIDEVLLCPHALSAAEVNAHFSGQAALSAANLI